MGDRVALSPELPEITPEIFTQATAIIGIRGSGKTNDGVVLAEAAIRYGVPVVVTDPTGVWHGLKSSADGKSPGLPVYVFGGAHADVPLDASAGPLLARFVVERRVPIILDLSDLTKGRQRRFVAEFSETLYDLKARARDPLLFILDEAARFVPQRIMAGEADLAKCVGAIEDIGALGRSRGLGLVLIGQRPAMINKNVLTQADNLIAMRTVGAQDRKAIDEWVSEAQGEQQQRDELVQHIPTLPTGQGYFWSPATFGVFRRVKFSARTTFDSSRTPKVGEKTIAPTAFAKVDLEALTAEIAATIEQAKADDPKTLRATIAERDREIVKLRNDRDFAPVEVERIVEKPVFTAEDRATFQQIADGLRTASEAYDAATTALNAVAVAAGSITDVMEAAVEDVVRSAKPLERRAAPVRTAPAPATDTSERGPTRSSRPEGSSEVGKIGAGERTVLIAIAQHRDGVTREQITILTGYKRSTRDAYVQRLRAAGLVEIYAAYMIHATKDGIKTLGRDFEPLPTGAALCRHWLSNLPEGEARILEFVLKHHPRGVGRDEISEATDFKRSTRDAYIQRLGTRKLVSAAGGEVRASDVLFDSGKR